MTPLDTPEYCPPRYCVKLKHKTKGRNIVYQTQKQGIKLSFREWCIMVTGIEIGYIITKIYYTL